MRQRLAELERDFARVNDAHGVLAERCTRAETVRKPERIYEVPQHVKDGIKKMEKRLLEQSNEIKLLKAHNETLQKELETRAQQKGMA